MLKLTKRELHRIFRIEDDKVIWNITSRKNKYAKSYRNNRREIKYMGIHYKYDDIYNALTNEFFNVTEDSIVDIVISINLLTSKEFIHKAISQLNKFFQYDALTSKFIAIEEKDKVKLITINKIDYIYIVGSFYPADEVYEMWKTNKIQIKNYKSYTIKLTKNEDINSIENKKLKKIGFNYIK